MITGTVHMRASVVEGGRTVFGSHGIAGKNFSELLTGKVSHITPPAGLTPPGSTRSRGSNSHTAPSFTRSSKSPRWWELLCRVL